MKTVDDIYSFTKAIEFAEIRDMLKIANDAYIQYQREKDHLPECISDIYTVYYDTYHAAYYLFAGCYTNNILLMLLIETCFNNDFCNDPSFILLQHINNVEDKIKDHELVPEYGFYLSSEQIKNKIISQIIE